MKQKRARKARSCTNSAPVRCACCGEMVPPGQAVMIDCLVGENFSDLYFQLFKGPKNAKNN